jgi:parallel beta-helix repeat protein
MLKIALVAAILPLLFWESEMPASTTVSGAIANETWTSANSPYLVVGDISVARLSIQPGVKVLFTGAYVFEIAGGIAAIGTLADPILFTQTNNSGGWQGILFNQNPLAAEMAYCRIEKAVNTGIRVLSSNPTIRNCVIANNRGAPGGGIYVSNTAPFVLQNCTITNNATSGEQGGGIYFDVPDATLDHCLVAYNHAVREGGGVYLQRFDQANLTVTDSTISSNTVTGSADAFGGGIFFHGGNGSLGTLVLRRSVIDGNGASGSLGGSAGGVYCIGSGVMENCLISHNVPEGMTADSSVAGRTFAMSNCVVANNQGGGLIIGAGNNYAQIINCVFAYNNTRGGVSAGDCCIAVTNSIFWGNTPAQILVGQGFPLLMGYSDVQGGYPGTENTAVNPVFTSLATYSILDASPCVDAGNPDPAFNDLCFPPSFGTTRNDMGAYGGPGACNWPIAPRITAQPLSQLTCVGRPVSFDVAAVGDGPLSYQWAFNGTPIARATDPTYSLSSVTTNDTGIYSVTVGDSFGLATSGAASLTVAPACVMIDLYPGLRIGGIVGQTYRVDFVTSLQATNNWLFLTNVYQSAPETLWVDPQPANNPRKFYRVELAP